MFFDLLTEVFAVFVIFLASHQFDNILTDVHSLAPNSQFHHNAGVVWINAFNLQHKMKVSNCVHWLQVLYDVLYLFTRSVYVVLYPGLLQMILWEAYLDLLIKYFCGD